MQMLSEEQTQSVTTPPYTSPKPLWILIALQDSVKTTMDQTFACVLLLLSLAGTFSKYVFINKMVTWHLARCYCLQVHTDLAPISNEYDLHRLRQLGDNFGVYIWMGLKRSSTDREEWMWSGGGRATTFFWDEGQPEGQRNEDYGLMRNSKWHDSPPDFHKPFFCYNVIVVRENKTWEEALNYCREHHVDLASVASDTEMLLIQRELSKDVTTQRVWIGLHFFAGHWLWVDGQPLAYKVWGEGGKPVCPQVELQCVALKVTGGNGSAPNATVAAGAVGVTEGEWEAHDCEERLPFLCY